MYLWVKQHLVKQCIPFVQFIILYSYGRHILLIILGYWLAVRSFVSCIIFSRLSVSSIPSVQSTWFLMDFTSDSSNLQSKIFHLCLLTLVCKVVMLPVPDGEKGNSKLMCVNESIKFYFSNHNIRFFSLYIKGHGRIS